MIELLKPTYAVASFGNIDPTVLQEEHPHIKAVTHDVDGYLMSYRDGIVPEAHMDVIKKIHENNLLQAIITNASSEQRLERVIAIADNVREVIGLAEFPVVASAAMPSYKRKPHPSMFRAAAKALGVELSEICHGGDQILRDVLGANRAGLGATIVTPRRGNDDHIGTRVLLRPLERLARVSVNLPVLNSGFSPAFRKHDC